MNPDGPKYWCEETEEVVDGVPLRKAPFPVSSLIGSYHWVWYGHPEDPHEVTKNDSGDVYGGITFRRKTSGKLITPSNIVGKFQLSLIEGKFGGLKVKKDRRTKIKIPNTWTVKDVEESDPCYEGAGMDISSDQEISVSETLDDNGHPFLVFAYTEGEGCHGVCDYDMVAKKQDDDLDIMYPRAWEGLTEDERDRLGIDLEDDEVEQMATLETGDEDGDEQKIADAEDKRPTAIKRKASSEGVLEGKATKVKLE